MPVTAMQYPENTMAQNSSQYDTIVDVCRMLRITYTKK